MQNVRVEAREARRIFGLEYALALARDWDEPLFLLWECAPTVMLGRHQLLENEVALPSLGEIALVRRMSGGGTIYTAPGCFQFTVLCRGEAREAQFDAAQAAILDALRTLGAPVVRQGRNDLTVEGKKCSGLAHYGVGEDTVVHHGTLLFDLDLAWLDRLLTPDARKLKARGIASVRARCANLAPYLGLSREEFFRKFPTLVTDGEYPLSPALLARAEAEVARFPTPVRTVFPDAEIRSGRFSGGLLTAWFTLRGGKFDTLAFTGDFFGEVAPLVSALVGVSADEGAILAALANVPLPPGLTAAWLSKLLTQAKEDS